MSRVGGMTNRLRRWLQHRHLPWHLALLAMLLCAPSLRLGWQTDDYFHRAALIDERKIAEFPAAQAEIFAYIRGDGRPRSPAGLFAFIDGDEKVNRDAISRGFLPWWSHEQLRISFFRPLTGLSHWIDYQLWPDFPWLMHLQSLVWLGGAVVVATFLYRRMLGATWVAGLAALLFAVDDAHGLPAVWLANRSATIAVFFGLLTLMAHDRWRGDGWRAGGLVAPPTLLAALLANEGAVAIGGYLLGYALFLDRGQRTARLLSLVPCALVGVMWWAAYKLMGFGVTGCGIYIDPGASPARFLGAIVERAPMLLLGQWAIPSDIRWVFSQRAAYLTWLGALGFLAIMALALAPLVKRNAVARFWVVGMLLSLVPACATFPSDRLLFFTGIGGMGLLAQLVAAVVQKAEWLSARVWWRWPSRALCVILLIFNLCAAPLGLIQSASNVERFNAVCARSAASLPSDAAIRNQMLLIVNTPTYYVSAIGALIETFKDRPLPARTFVLASGIHPTVIRRPDEQTLIVRPAGGYLAAPGSPEPGRESDQPWFDWRYGFPMLDQLYRDNTPMPVGQRIGLVNVTVEILAVTDDARPAEAAFHFATKLEDSSLRWLRWEHGVFVPFELPAVGAALTLPAVITSF